MYRDAITLARAFCYICLLKYRPQDVPASRELLLAQLSWYISCWIACWLNWMKT